MSSVPWLIVGAGLTGAILAERIASQLKQKVLLVDRRNHIAGNIMDRRDDDGLLYHHYGPHLFHTNSDEVVEYLSQFTDWYDYEHRVVAEIDGRLVPVPFNLTSLRICFGAEKAARLEALLVERYGLGTKVPILPMMEDADGDLAELARFIFDKVFVGYTSKQWGLAPSQLAPSVMSRVPVHISTDDRYFQDKFQRLPALGYTAMVERILDHPNIEVRLNTDWADVRDLDPQRVIFTGPIDEFFDCRFGRLPYRSLSFDFQTYAQPQHQPVAQVNYPNRYDYTRITEMAHFTKEWGDKAKLAVEYPQAYEPGENEPYYPIPNDESANLYARYRELAAAEAPHVLFAGRLGEYQYYNMDQAVARALDLFRAKIAAD